MCDMQSGNTDLVNISLEWVACFVNKSSAIYNLNFY